MVLKYFQLLVPVEKENWEMPNTLGIWVCYSGQGILNNEESRWTLLNGNECIRDRHRVLSILKPYLDPAVGVGNMVKLYENLLSGKTKDFYWPANFTLI